MVLLGALILGGCAALKQIAIDVASCAVGEVPSAVADVLPEVKNAIAGTAADWAGELAKLEAMGIDFARCAIQAVVFDLSKNKAINSMEGIRSLDRANVALEYLNSKVSK